MNYIPSQDQIMGQLRVIIPSVGVIISAFGVSTIQEKYYEGMILAAIGPISFLIVTIWSAIANSRKSIMLSAAKPVDANTPAPQIVLPAAEAALAQVLPSNVTTTQTTTVVQKGT